MTNVTVIKKLFKIPLIHKLSETSLDVNIPSYTGSPRSLNYGSKSSLKSDEEHEPKLKRAVSFLLEDNNFLVAAETGNDKLLEIIIRKGTNIQQQDYLGRNALHLAVCAGNKRAIIILLDAGVNANVKDNVGMTPLSLCLMRRPSLDIANLLFDHGAVIVPRSNPVDTGLFLQFVMMCKPTYEEARILKLLVEKGALVNDPAAPGGRQALHFAAMSNNCVLIRILLDLGADMYLTNHRHETPKDVAITYKCRDTLTLLQEFEAN
ncbi:uncharacterized protein LOC113516191 [Galleria mellonella]|uniref:Uncharacterized protein LOC113516191 n=1 Tax=Galleria mellonella TaxID=7137 RepID=A0ABM3N046_GALME|nr:uncharacterized protein LOC113516191 [Galleria mellonella]